MKINEAVFTPFMGYMKSTGHNVDSRYGYLVLTKGKNKATIDCMNDDLELNSYGYRMYMEFMYKWLNQGKQFIRSMRNLGAMIVTRLQGRNYLECWK